MRATLTLDDDIYRRLREMSYKTGKSFKEVVNETLRHNLEPVRLKKKYRLPTLDPGTPKYPTVANTGELLELLEGPLYK